MNNYFIHIYGALIIYYIITYIISPIYIYIFYEVVVLHRSTVTLYTPKSWIFIYLFQLNCICKNI